MLLEVLLSSELNFSAISITIIIMKGFGLGLLVLIVSIFYLDAFLPPFHPPSTTTSRQQASKRLESPNDEGLQSNMEHGDILWKLRPPKESSRRKRLWTRFAANLIRLDCLIKRQEMPLVLCPKGGQVVLEAHYRPNNNTNNNNSKRYKQIARFGFTTMAGPSNQPIQDTVHDLYGLSADRQYRVGAIIYMFVEEGYRKVGKKSHEICLFCLKMDQLSCLSRWLLIGIPHKERGRKIGTRSYSAHSIHSSMRLYYACRR
jgi:hypothetical protein